MHSPQILVGRVRLWVRYEIVPAPTVCDECRLTTVEVRETSAGLVCLECWLELPVCAQCGVGVGSEEWENLLYCPDCLNPPVSEEYLLEERQRMFEGRSDHPLREFLRVGMKARS